MNSAPSSRTSTAGTRILSSRARGVPVHGVRARPNSRRISSNRRSMSANARNGSAAAPQKGELSLAFGAISVAFVLRIIVVTSTSELQVVYYHNRYLNLSNFPTAVGRGFKKEGGFHGPCSPTTAFPLR